MPSRWLSVPVSALVSGAGRPRISRQLNSSSQIPCKLSGNVRTYQSGEDLPPSRPAVFSVAQMMWQGAQHLPRHSKAELSFSFKGKWGLGLHWAQKNLNILGVR